MADKSEVMTEALEEIKSQVETKFEGVALTADVETKMAEVSDTKADKSEIVEVKEALEALEAKFDAIPSPQIISNKEQTMNSVNEAFVKSLEDSGKAFAEVEIKGISEGNNVTGAPTQTLGLTGSSFAANPFRRLASVIQTTSKALELPVRSGNHGAANAGATKNVTDGGTAAVGTTTLVVQTYAARSDVSIEAASDIVGFDQFWSQDMLDEVASIEAQAHVTAIEAMTGGTTAGSGTALALDDFADLIFDKVGAQYRANGALVVSSGAMAQLRTLNTASTGGDLVFDAQIGTFRLFGQPVYENAYMANPALNAVVAAYGDFKKGFVIANRKNATVGRFDQTVPGKYTYYAELRAGAGEWDASAVKTLKMAAA